MFTVFDAARVLATATLVNRNTAANGLYQETILKHTHKFILTGFPFGHDYINTLHHSHTITLILI